MDKDHQEPKEKLPGRKDRLSDHQIDERAAEAESLLHNSVFKDALDDVYSRSLGILLNADVGSLTASTAHASMKAVRDVRNQLEEYVSDRKMRQRFGK